MTATKTESKRAKLVAWACCLAEAVGCRPVMRPDGGSGLLPTSAVAPDVIGTLPNGAQQSLHASRGHMALVYFYPKDDTPGCTKEACALRDSFDEYAKRGMVIFGVSQDDEASHREFAEKHRLPFALVADESGDVARSYGVRSTFGFSSRVSFLVDAQGKIAHVWPDVDPALHADSVLQVVDQLEAKTQ